MYSGVKQVNTHLREDLLETVRSRAYAEGRPMRSLMNDALVLYLVTTTPAYRYGAPDATLETPYRDPDNPAVLYEKPVNLRKFQQKTKSS